MKKVSVIRIHENIEIPDTDVLAVEEPLEIRLVYGPASERKEQALSVTMRTPGDDAELTAGFLFTEGIICRASDILEIREERAFNRCIASLNPVLEVDIAKAERNFYTTSSCGVCGKSSIDALQLKTGVVSPETPPALSAEIIVGLPDKLRRAQAQFELTGGIHASALFDVDGELLYLCEDVGRHNALDKLIGRALLDGALPLSGKILLLSGRASFELIQKAAMAGIGVVCAVGAPSSLAVETAEAFGMTLIGFLRGNRFNRYAG